MVDETFEVLRACGAGERECKLYWVSYWRDPEQLIGVVHPEHDSSRYGLTIHSEWITKFWNELVDQGLGVRVQVHTHPGVAFHSSTDDAYPLIHDVGFLSLVIPDFALGAVGFDRAYLTEIQPDGGWRQVPASERFAVHD
jgi:proteasome lid subunit RPN8/RPN11